MKGGADIAPPFSLEIMKLKILLIVTLITISLHSEGSELDSLKIGLALGGGGARGFAHIGVLKVIDELEIPIDYIAGTSSGAVIGALYAMGYSAVQIEEMILDLKWQDIFDEKICRENEYIGNKRWKPYANVFFDVQKNLLPKLPSAFLSGNNLTNLLFDLTFQSSETTDFEQLPIPFRCVATNILTGERKEFSRGYLLEAIRASMSFPSIMQPFEVDNQLYIDGGILANLPVETVRDMGADFIIGIQTSSGLKSEKELVSLIDVLDQTINLRITQNVEKSAELCDILLVPDLHDISLMDFHRVKELIDLGEIAAREYFSSNKMSLPKHKKKKSLQQVDEVKFSRIKVQGNKYLSDAKVKEFIGLKPGENYSKKEIKAAFADAYHSQLFEYIYPVIDHSKYSSVLYVKLKERNRYRYGFNLSYNDNNDISLGITLDMNNVLQKNSKCLLNAQVGDSQELNLDYVKNFGKHWGVYYRLFPYIKEFRFYSYNDDHEKTNSVRSLEYGGTFGIGIFTRKALIAELYGFTFHSGLYKDIAEFDDSDYRSTGVGLKLYHENLDDFVFPMQGTSLYMKYSVSNEEFYSDEDIRTFFTRLQMLLPFAQNFSIKYQFEYGSHFEKLENDFDPFYIGGIDSFLGLNAKEKSAPTYKINTIAFRFEPYRNSFFDLQLNILNLGDVDYWQPEKFTYKGGGVVLGYKTYLGPIRIGAALDEDKRSYYYLSIGYEFDPFEFSRR